MRHWENLDAIEREPSKMIGAWVFRKTRVPVSALFENLRDGATVEDFLEWFPPVQRSQVEAVLNYELDMLAVAAQIMRILFDQGTPVPLRKYLTEHSVTTAYVVLLSTSWPKIRTQTDKVCDVINEIKLGDYVEISI